MSPRDRISLKPDDVRRAATVAVEALRPLAGEDWSVRSGNGVEWDVRSTLLHVAAGLGFYGAQLATLETEEHDEPDIVLQTPIRDVLTAVERRAAVLAEVAKAAPPEARAVNSGAMADAEGFIAMGCDETIVHTDDILKAFGRPFEPPPELCRAILNRLFPDAPAEGDGWAVLLWANGRGTIPGREPLGPDWTWHPAPLATASRHQ